jgi:hypothetical protein
VIIPRRDIEVLQAPAEPIKPNGRTEENRNQYRTPDLSSRIPMHTSLLSEGLQRTLMMHEKGSPYSSPDRP